MAFPRPVPGLVLRYSYLWLAEHLRGQEEGVKNRPCAVVMIVTNEQNEQVVTVLPITHTPPTDPALAVEIPHETKRRLALDDAPSWIVVTEANQFFWPGPDLRLGPAGDAAGTAFGILPRALYKDVQGKLALAIKTRLFQAVPRTQ